MLEKVIAKLIYLLLSKKSVSKKLWNKYQSSRAGRDKGAKLKKLFVL